jgi:pimeloyl-ACP methyl ester carboxylesterase
MSPAAPAGRRIRLGDGRALTYWVWGNAAGTPLLMLHGTPGSRSMLAIGHDAGRELGLAIVAPDRWGYGLSDRPRTAVLPAFAADMAILMDRLGYARFAVGGISGGAVYAAAVAAGLPTRVTALALVSPMGPAAHPECRLSPYHRFCFSVLPRSPLAISAIFALLRASLRSPRCAGELVSWLAGPRDKARLARPEIADWLIGSFREGLRGGLDGPALDFAMFARAWDVDLGAIRVPACVWIGTADRAVPLGAARLLARSIRRCVLVELPGEGHFWVADHARQVLEWVVRTQRVDGPPKSCARPPSTPAAPLAS